MLDFSQAFRGYAVTSVVASSSPGVDIPVLMPSDVQAGDYLFVNGGNFNLNIISGLLAGEPMPTGWTFIGQAGQMFAKLADGSEGGTTVHFQTRDTTGFGGPDQPRNCLVFAMCYRWPAEPVHNVAAGRGPFNTIQRSIPRFLGGPNVPGNNPVIDSADPVTSGTAGGPYPSSTTPNRIEVRILSFIGAGSFITDETTGPQECLDSAAWYGLNMVDRTGLDCISGGDEHLPNDNFSLTMSDAMGIGDTNTSTPQSGIVITHDNHPAGWLAAMKLFWLIPPENYWGINASTPTP